MAASVRYTCLLAIVKVLHVTPAPLLEVALREVPICSFIAGLPSGRDAVASAYGLQMAEMLMDKLPCTFRTLFLKEGVLHAMEQLEASAKPKAPAEAAPAEKAGQAKEQQGPSSAAGGACGNADAAPSASAPVPPSRSTRASSRLREDKDSKDKEKVGLGRTRTRTAIRSFTFKCTP